MNAARKNTKPASRHVCDVCGGPCDCPDYTENDGCMSCGCSSPSDYDECPHCGADMDEPDDHSSTCPNRETDR